MFFRPLALLAPLALGLAACGSTYPNPALLLPSAETRINITANTYNPQLAIDCSDEIGRYVQHFQRQVGDGDAYGALYVGYDEAAGSCGDYAIARRAHSPVDAGNLAAAICERRNEGEACYEIALAVPVNHRDGVRTVSQRLGEELEATFQNPTGFGAAALSATGAYGYSTGQASPEAAEQAALNACRDRVAAGFDRNTPRYINPALVVNSACNVIATHNDVGEFSVDVVR